MSSKSPNLSQTKINPLLIAFAIVLLFSATVRFFLVNNYSFAFTMDQARDMLDIRRLIVGHTPLIVGPTTGLTGLFLGPFWYYFNAPAFILGGGNPAVMVHWLSFWHLFAGVAIFIFLKKQNQILALIFSTLFLLSPLYLHTSAYSLNPNLLPLLFLLILWVSVNLKNKPIYLIILGLLSGISLQTEAALAIVFIPSLLVLFLYQKIKLQYLIYFFLTLAITFLPQFIYELRHNFSMSQLLLSQLSGKADYLTNKLSLGQKLLDQLNYFSQSLTFTFDLPLVMCLPVLLVITLYNLLNLKSYDLVTRKIFTYSHLFILFAFIFYLFYPFPLRLWYLHSFGLIYLYSLSLALSHLYSRHLKSLVSLTILFLLISLFVFKALTMIIVSNAPSDNPSNLNNRLLTIDYIYSIAKDKPFAIYVYSPAVYDHPYHYLFWWKANTYKYQPSIVSYSLTPAPSILDNPVYWRSSKSLDKTQLTFLIVEPGDHPLYQRQTWLEQFNSLCQLETKKEFNWQTQIYILRNCKQ